MKIKHWQGYGTVSATRIKDKNCTLHIRLTGNHEWGLRRDDMYDLYNWLVKRFDKSVPLMYSSMKDIQSSTVLILILVIITSSIER